MKNRYIFGTHISERKTRPIIKYFSVDIEAKKAAELTGISRPTYQQILWYFSRANSRDLRIRQSFYQR
jgi:hypothetical protein